MNASSVQPFHFESERSVNQEDTAEDSTQTLYENEEDQRDPTMAGNDQSQQFQDHINYVFSQLQSKQLFQSKWGFASFAVFVIYIGMVLVLVVLVIIRCCCCWCCDEKPKRRRVGIDNLGLEP